MFLEIGMSLLKDRDCRMDEIIETAWMKGSRLPNG